MHPLRLLIPVLLVFLFCGFAVTARAAAPLDCALPGDRLLAGIIVVDCPAATARFDRFMAAKPTIRDLGLDRHGRARIIPRQGRVALQEHLLRDGIAFAYDLAATPNPWQRAEREAIAAARGVWADPAWKAAAADDLPIGEFLFVTGRVTRIYEGREATYLNFGEDWREDFSAMVPRRHLRAFKDTLGTLHGKRVRVRGVTILENGPMITLSRPEQLEILDADAR